MAIQDAINDEGVVDSVAVASRAINYLSTHEIYTEARAHLADRVRHMVNPKGDDNPVGIRDNEPTERLIAEAEQPDLFGFRVQTWYSINGVYKRIDSLSEIEIRAKAATLFAKGKASMDHADALLRYLRRRGAVAYFDGRAS